MERQETRVLKKSVRAFLKLLIVILVLSSVTGLCFLWWNHIICIFVNIMMIFTAVTLNEVLKSDDKKREED
ncbi:MAG: hypothetical protein LBM93_02550 [Oscillospiraceae bacterium]|nr:hypothetical protein [Oscillospiraceae bacterium]